MQRIPHALPDLRIAAGRLRDVPRTKVQSLRNRFRWSRKRLTCSRNSPRRNVKSQRLKVTA